MREPKEPGHVVKFGSGLHGLIRKGWWHIPEVLGASLMALVGIGLATAGCYKYYQCDGDNREYKSTYLVVRAGDPRECRIKNPVFTTYRPC